MDFGKYLDETAKKLDEETEIILNWWLKEVKKIDKRLVPLANAFIKACEGGKRIRGVLIKLGYELVGHHKDVQGKEILKIGAAYEILHASILAHDDIIDESPIRRGQSSLYKKVGISQAITLADLGFFLAMKIISESNFEDKLKIQAMDLFSNTLVDTAVGQMLDITDADSKLVAKLKTARYTISGPLKLGAILGGAEGKLIRELGEFGENLGIAFQIRDDILDGEVESVEKAEAEALQYTSSAKKIIPKLTDNISMEKSLDGMVDYMVGRKR